MNEALKTVKKEERGREERREQRMEGGRVTRGRLTREKEKDREKEREGERGKAVVPVQRVLVEYFGARR